MLIVYCPFCAFTCETQDGGWKDCQPIGIDHLLAIRAIPVGTVRNARERCVYVCEVGVLFVQHRGEPIVTTFFFGVRVACGVIVRTIRV